MYQNSRMYVHIFITGIVSLPPLTAPPQFTVAPESVTTKTGSRVTLECEADGNPLPHIWWKRNGQPLSETNRIYLSDDDIELTIEHVKESDAGEFYHLADRLV